MVAAISSSGLGLFGSSVAALGGIGASGSGGVGRGNDRVYVNTATGNLVIQSLDEHLRTVGPDINLIRTYNSQGFLDDDNGDNWRMNVHQRLYNLTGQVNTANSTIIKVFGDAREVTYEYDESVGAYISSEGADAHDTLRFSDGIWTWTEGTSRLAETYDAQYRLSSTRDADGNTVSYTYDGSRLVQVNAGSGQTLQTTQLIYTGNNLTGIRVSSNGVMQTLTTYEYDSLNRLNRVIVDLTPTITTDAVTYVTDYTYEGTTRRVASITQSDGSSVSFTYELISGQYRIKTYTDGEGRLTTLNYSQATGSVSGGGMPINQAANGAVLDTTRTTTHALNTSAYTVPNGSWAAAVQVDTNDTHAATPRMVFDGAGNGFAVWAQGSDVIVRRYTARTATWSATETLDSSNQSASTPMLAIDRASGAAVVAWVQSDGSVSSLYARRYDPATNSWSAVQTVDSAPGAVSADVSVSMTGAHVAIGWIQNDGTANSVYFSRLVSGSWTTPTVVDGAVDAATQVQVAVDANGNATLLWRQVSGGEQRIHTRRWNNATQTLSSITQLDNAGDRMPRIGMDAQGNIFAAWSFGAQVRRYDAATGQWEQQLTLQNGSDSATNAELAVDQLGNALVAWMESNGTTLSVYARHYDASTGQWGPATRLQTSGNPVNGDQALTVSLSGGVGIVGWLEVAGSVSDVYAARFSGGTWTAPVSLESGTQTAAQLSSAIDDAGNATVLWQQADTAARSIFRAQYFSPHLVVPSGATWQSIASAMYGVNSVAAGNALQAAMGGGALVAGTRLSGLPVSLQVTTTVPGYYAVRVGDTWAHITQTIYGTNDSNAVARLQEALSNPSLVFGLQLDVPATLSFVSSSSYTAPLQWSQVGTTGTQTYNLNGSGLIVPNGSWSPASLLETGPATATNPRIAFDAAGNGLALWVQGSDVIVRRYVARSASWSAEVVLDSRTEEVDTASLAIDRATGAAIVAWVQSDGPANSLYTRRYDAVTNSWGTSQLIESAAGAVSGAVSLSMTGGHAAIGWLQHDGTTYSVYQSRLVNGGWSAPALMDTRADEAMQAQIAIDANGNTTLLWRQRGDDSEYHISSRRWDNTAQTYSAVTLLDGNGDRMPRLALDAQGNGFALWGFGTQVRRFDAATGQWGPQVSLQAGTSDATWNAELAVSPNGDALVAWQENDGTTLSVYVRRYNATTGQWSAASRISSGATHLDHGLTVSLNGNHGVVGWVVDTGTSVDAYAARLNGTTWGPPTLLESGPNAATLLASAIDTAGNVTVLWQQADDISRSIYQAHSANAPYFLVTAGATWQSIASELYGVNSEAAGTALLAAMGAPPLIAGTRLQFFPPTLTVTVPVPPFYIVQSGDTWASIAQGLYGSSAPSAISALQTVLGTSTLTPGLRLVVPRSLSFSNTSGAAASFLQTEVVNAAGVVTRYEQDALGRLAAVTVDSDGASLRTVYSYDGDGNVISIVEDPTGLSRFTTFEYDEHGNWLTRRDSVGNTVTRTYDPVTQQLLTETSYVIRDPDFSGPRQPSTPLTTRYIYDSEQHLRFVISPQGRVTEHQYNSAGLRTLTRSFTGNRYLFASPTEELLQSWASVVDLTKLELTTYAYDFRGNLLSSTSYAATAANGAGEGAPSITYFIYDQRGQLLQTIDARAGNVTLNPNNPSSNPGTTQPYSTTYTYDGLGRVQTATQWDATWGAISTQHSYDDANRRVSTTSANGLITTSYYNRVGELVKVTNGVSGALDSLGTTTYAYDDVGRLRIVTDPIGVRQFFFYDAAGRKIGEVDGDGTVTQYVYNDANQVVKTVQYAARLSSATLASLVSQSSGQPTSVTFATVRSEASANPSQDRIKRNTYDAAGGLAHTIDEAGAVTQYLYDGLGRLIETILYEVTVSIDRSVDEVDPSNVWTRLTPEHDRRTRYFYDDKDGLVGGILDGEGGLTEYLYDAGGRLVREIRYANVPDQSWWRTEFLFNLKAAAGTDDETAIDPERDIITDYFYDGQGRRIGVLDGEGYFTHTQYDGTGNVVERARYDHVLTRAANVTAEQLLAQIPATSVRERSVYTYNAEGQVLTEVFTRGTSTTSASVTTYYAYDRMGWLTSTTRAAGSSNARTVQTRYDFLGRVIKELTAEGSALITAGMSQADIEQIWNLYSVSYAYDASGLKISATTRPKEQQVHTTLFFYDDDGRLRFEVNALGERTEYRYNALNQLSDRIRYTNRIATTGLAGGRLTSQLLSALTANANAGEDAVTTFTYKLTGRVHTERTGRTSNVADDTVVTYDYNTFGEVRTSTNSYGVATEYRYDRRGLLTSTISDVATGGLNITSGRTYDAFGRLRTMSDGRNAVAYRYEYDRLGRQIASTDSNPLDRTETTYDAFSRTKTVRDALNNVTVYSYDDASRRMTVTTPEGIAVVTVFTEHGQTLSVSVPGSSTSYQYDRNGQVISVSDGLGTIETRTYDRAGRLDTQTDANSIITRFAYDAASRVLTRTVDAVAGGLQLVTTYTYDGQGRIFSVEEPGSYRTETLYYRDGRIKQTAVDPGNLNLRTYYSYDREGRTVTVTEGHGSDKPRVTTYEYDQLGRRTAEIVDMGTGINPVFNAPYLNLRTRYRYDANGNVSRKIDANGHSTWYVYDADNRLTHTIDALGGVTVTSYDAEDRITETRRLATVLSEQAMTLLNSRDVVSTADFTLTYTNSDRLVQFVYDRDGAQRFMLEAINESAAVLTERTFDASGRVTRERIYSTTIPIANYTTTDQVVAAILREGASVTSLGIHDRVSWAAYDLRGRKAFTVDGLGNVVKYNYDGKNNVVATTAFAAAQTGTFVTDFAALTTWTNANTSNADNRVTRMWYDTTGRLRFTFDAEAYLKEVRYDDAGRQEHTVTYGYADWTPATFSASTTLAAVAAEAAARANTSVDQKTTTQYDAAGRVWRVTEDSANPTSSVYEEYGYDAAGNRTSFRNKKGAVWTYEYDANSRLKYERSPSVEVTSVVDAGNSLSSSTSSQSIVTYIEYDDVGNVRARTEAFGTSQARRTEYLYDRVGRQTHTIHSATATTPRLETIVAYDALGNAFRNLDVGNAYSYKIHDRLGRVQFEIDEENYVTEYIYDTFGNQTTLRRYAEPLRVALPFDTSSLSAAHLVEKLFATPTADRSVVTAYDRLNRVTEVVRPYVYNFAVGESVPGGTAFIGGGRTTYQYNAFGNVVLSRELIGNDIFADTFHYYDRLGQKIAQVDAMNFLTQYEYDETGDLKRQIEYARALSQTPTIASYGSPPVATPGQIEGRDRETVYGYDRLNRKISETQMNVAYTTFNGSTPVQQVGNRVTSYGYDEVGNLVQTRTGEAGAYADSYTYYDALGRVRATAEPTRDRGNGGLVTPLTVMRRDAHGNLVEQIAYANGALTVSGTNYAVGNLNNDPVSGDRVTRMLVDHLGRTLRTEDPFGVDRHARYNSRGQITEEWQIVTNLGTTEELRTTYVYDRLGRQKEVIEPQRVVNGAPVNVTTRSEYNAFGEIIAKGVNGLQETFEYDQAGRLWRTNSGDGVVKIFQHDVAGNVTVQLKAQVGGQDLNAVADAHDASYVGLGVMRTETRYDKLGRVVEQREPRFIPNAPVQAIGGAFQIGTPENIQRLFWDSLPVSGATMNFRYRVVGQQGWSTLTPQYIQTDTWEGIPIYGWAGVNISGLTGNYYEYELTYTRAGESSHYAIATGRFNLTLTQSTVINSAPGNTRDVAQVIPEIRNGREVMIWATLNQSWSFQTTSRTTGATTSYAVYSDSNDTWIGGASWIYVDEIPGGINDFFLTGKRNGEIITAQGSTISITPPVTTTVLQNHAPAPQWEVVAPVSGASLALPQLTATRTGSASQQLMYGGRGPKGEEWWYWAWVGTNSVSFSDVGNGVRVVLEYYTVGGQELTRDEPLSGSTLSWLEGIQDPLFPQYDGGISSVKRARIYDAAGNLVRDTAGTVSIPALSWAPASFPLVSAYIGETPLTVQSINGRYYASLAGVPPGTYDVAIVYQTLEWIPDHGGVYIPWPANCSATLRVTVSGGSVQVLSQENYRAAYTPTAINGSRLTWSGQPGDEVVFGYRADSNSPWVLTTAQSNGSSFYFDFYGLPFAPRYEYSFFHRRNGRIVQEGEGSMRVQTTHQPAAYNWSGSTSNVPALITGIRQDSNNSNLLRWEPAPNGGTVEVLYKTPGSVSWTGSLTSANGTSVDMSALASGQYFIEIRYKRADGTVYGLGSATVTLSRPTNASGTPYDTTHITLGEAAAVPPTKQGIDRWGNVLWVEDAAHNITNYRYGRDNQLTETVLPSATVVSTVNRLPTTTVRYVTTSNYYDLLGRLIGTRDGNDNLNRATYNVAGQVVSEQHADGGVKQFVFDAFGNVVQVEDEAGYQTRNVYDKADRLITVARELQTNGFRYEDDPFGLTTSTVSIEQAYLDALIIESYGYDEAGRRITETNGENETTRYFYDLHGNLTQRTSAGGRSMYYSYDAQGRKVYESWLPVSATPTLTTYMTWSYNYFGRVTDHKDLSGRDYIYEYDPNSGLLTRQSTVNSPAGMSNMDIRYSYDWAGHVTKIDDWGVGRLTEYQYDGAGRRIREKVTIEGRVHQNLVTTYDQLNRISTLSDVRYNLSYSYDAAGNRTHTLAYYYDYTNNRGTEDLWYSYDAMNRVAVSEGSINAQTGRIEATTSQGAELEYDDRGLRISENSAGSWTQEVYETWHDSMMGTKIYTYDGLGRLVQINRQGRLDTIAYDKASRVNYRDEHAHRQAWNSTENGGFWYWEPTRRVQATAYDDDGYVLAQLTKLGGLTESEVFFGAPGSIGQTVSYLLLGETISTVIQNVGYGTNGVLYGYQAKVNDLQNGRTYLSYHTYQYDHGDGVYLERTHSVDNQGGSGTPGDGSTTKTYNANGELIKYVDNGHAAETRYFANNAAGQAITAVQGAFDAPGARNTAFINALTGQGGINTSRSRHSFFANGEFVGSVGQLTGHLTANFDVNYTPISDSYPSSVPSSYVVQTGDTLYIVADRVFGDRSLWYLIADANGLGADAVLEPGRQLTIPNVVAAQSNTSSSFKPFNPAEVIGDTTPLQPIPPMQKKGCGIVGQIFVLVIAAVVAYASWGTGSGWAAGLGETLLGSGTAGAVAGGAIAGAAGSAISQGVAIGLGIQQSFDWKAVALSAISTGVGKGLQASSLFKDAMKALEWSADAQSAFAGATGSILTQGLAVVTDLQSSFSWRDVAISAASAPITNSISSDIASLTNSAFAAEFGSRIAGSVIRGAMGGKVDAKLALADAFGNALVNSITDRLSGGSADELREVRITPRYIGPGAEAANARLNNNPSNPITNPAVAMTPDEMMPDEMTLGEMSAPDAGRVPPGGGLEGVVVQARKLTKPQEQLYDRLISRWSTIGGKNEYEAMAIVDRARRNDIRYETSASIENDRALISMGLATVGGAAAGAFGAALYPTFLAYSNSVLLAGGASGVSADVAFQGYQNALFEGTDGAYGRSGIDGTELALSAGLGLLPGLPMAIRGWADDLRGLGVPDWNIRFSSPGTLYSNGIGLELERIAANPSVLKAELARISNEGHALARHGGSVTNEKLTIRARTGVAPDGSYVVNDGNIVVPTASSAFNTDELLVQADLLVREQYLERAIVLSKPGTTRLVIDGANMGAVVGRGYERVAKTPNLPGPLRYYDDLTRATAVYEYDATVRAWRTITIYPVK